MHTPLQVICFLLCVAGVSTYRVDISIQGCTASIAHTTVLSILSAPTITPFENYTMATHQVTLMPLQLPLNYSLAYVKMDVYADVPNNATVVIHRWNTTHWIPLESFYRHSHPLVSTTILLREIGTAVTIAGFVLPRDKSHFIDTTTILVALIVTAVVVTLIWCVSCFKSGSSQLSRK
jgi:hypothetical protein